MARTGRLDQWNRNWWRSARFLGRSYLWKIWSVCESTFPNFVKFAASTAVTFHVQGESANRSMLEAFGLFRPSATKSARPYQVTSASLSLACTTPPPPGGPLAIQGGSALLEGQPKGSLALHCHMTVIAWRQGALGLYTESAYSC